MGLLFRHQAGQLGGIARHDGRVARTGEDLSDVPQHLGIVVHRQRADPSPFPRRERAGEAGADATVAVPSAAGRVKVNRAPRPGPSLSARMRPPWASTMPLQMASPKPDPPMPEPIATLLSKATCCGSCRPHGGVAGHSNGAKTGFLAELLERGRDDPCCLVGIAAPGLPGPDTKSLTCPNAAGAFHGIVVKQQGAETMRHKIRRAIPFAMPRTRQTVHDRDAMKFLAEAKAVNHGGASSPT